MILNSFILSNTPFQQINWWSQDLSKEELAASHVLFQRDDQASYIGQLLGKACDARQVAIEA